MPKAKSIITLSGTISGVTHVDSRAYGPHVRARRGTYTPITLAEGMKESSQHQTKANLMAKLIFDAVNQFAPGFKNGRFWSRLVAVFRQQNKIQQPYNYTTFNGIEMRPDYPTSGLANIELTAEQEEIKVAYNFKADAGHQLSLLRIAADETLLNPHPSKIQTVELAAAEQVGVATFTFTPLPAQSATLYALKIEKLELGKPTGFLKDKSVAFYMASQP